MFITRKHIPRRTALKAMGVSLALPLLDAMVPAVTAFSKTAAAGFKTRLIAMEMVHGAAGSSQIGASKNLWSPAKAGRDFDLTPTSLEPLTPFRHYLTIV